MRKDRSKQVQALISQALQAAQMVGQTGTMEQRPQPSLSGPPAAPGSVGEAAFNSALQKLIAASGGKIKVTSGKRDSAKQQQLWQKALQKYGDPEIADNWVARPGTSNHERGIAADLSFADPQLKQWAHSVAGQYGLHFPMSHEPWHIEPLNSRKSRK